MTAIFCLLVASAAAFASSDGSDSTFRLTQLRKELQRFEGFYVASAMEQAPRAVRISIDSSDDHLILDAWSGGRIERLLEMSLAGIIGQSEPEAPAMFYFTGLELPAYQYGNFRRAALFYFFLFYYNQGERTLSLAVREFGRTIFRIENAVDKEAGQWPQSNDSLSKFLAGDYELPPLNPICDIWLRDRP